MKTTNSNGDHPKTRVDEKDGTVYEWNERFHGWFPKVTDELIQNFTSQYSNSHKRDESETPESLYPLIKKRKHTNVPENQPKQPEWFEVDPANTTHAYISGLPLDTTEDEFIDMMTKYGIIMEDPESKKLKIKLYKNKDGKFKGDGLVCYLKHESVELAIDLLDESELRGSTVRVEPARFDLKGAYNPCLKSKKKKKSKDKQQDKLLDWVDRDQYKKQAHKRACVIHHLFEPQEFIVFRFVTQDDPSALIDYKQELQEECEKFGCIKKRSIDGVASILFKDEESALRCIKAMDGRACNGRVLIAHLWDGVTKYEDEETKEQMEDRINRWHKSLE